MSITYIDANRLNSIDYESENTNVWTYPIGNNIRLPTGSQVSIQNSLINQKGILGNSIEIEEDIVEEIRANVYITDDSHLIPDQIPFENRNKAYPFLNILSVHNRNDLFELGSNPNTTPQEYINSIYDNNGGKGSSSFGGSQQPLILYKKITGSSGQPVFTPVIIEKIINIPKGVYGINQLADFITDQINGKKKFQLDGSISDVNPIDIQIEAGFFQGAYGAGAGLTETLNLQNHGVKNYDTSANGSVTPADVDYPFITNEEHVGNINSFDGLKIESNVANFNTANKFMAHLRDNQRAKLVGETDPEYENVTDYRLARIGYTIGAPAFNISFDPSRNGYELKNLHQPYRPPTIDFLGNPISSAGSVSIGIRTPFGEGTSGTSNPFRVPTSTGVNNAITIQSRSRILSALKRPRSRISGAIIYNFALRTAQKEGDVQVVIDNSATNSSKFKDFFTTDAKAKVAWRKTLWSRLGFSYEQLNDVNHREDVVSYDRDIISKLEGITTDADFDMGMNQSISNQVCPTTYQPTGTGDTTDNLQTFEVVDYNLPKRVNQPGYPAATTSLYNNIKSYTGSMTESYTLINVTVQDRPIVARTLPTLSKYGYYLITSNIIPGHNDIVKKSTNLPLLGIIPKSSLSNQDFISVQNQIIHTITNPISLNNIRIEVLNPDLTPAQLEPNSSVILKIVTPEEEEEVDNN